MINKFIFVTSYIFWDVWSFVFDKPNANVNMLKFTLAKHNWTTPSYNLEEDSIIYYLNSFMKFFNALSRIWWPSQPKLSSHIVQKWEMIFISKFLYN